MSHGAQLEDEKELLSTLSFKPIPGMFGSLMTRKAKENHYEALRIALMHVNFAADENPLPQSEPTQSGQGHLSPAFGPEPNPLLGAKFIGLNNYDITSEFRASMPNPDLIGPEIILDSSSPQTQQPRNIIKPADNESCFVNLSPLCSLTFLQ